nr:peptidoglycan DD-metalloendopeptidase family protein [Propionicimonas sp.]
MDKTLGVLAGSLGLLLMATPLTLASVLTTVVVPGNLVTQRCGGVMPATGEWRVPFVDVDYTITSPFGMRVDPVTGATTSLHNGVDLATPQSNVVATASGQVTFAGWEPGFGNHVVIDHGGGVTTLYGHLASIDPAVTAGASVGGGQTLGIEGTTGWSTGIHLHFTITVGGVDVDPVAFMLERGAPLDGQPVGPTSVGTVPSIQEGGVGFDLPQPEQRQDSLNNPALPIPADIQRLYEAAATAYGLPWTLLAGVGMEETAHGRTTATSSAGAQGLMQFMTATFAAYGVDGDGDGHADITNPADSVHSAANYLVASGATRGTDGVRDALFAYNHADWYVGDVLFYAHTYGGGQVLGSLTDCPPGTGNPLLPPLADPRVVDLLDWATSQVGRPYVMGGKGPDSYDCSGLVKAAFARIGITTPRTAQTQRDWLAAGNGFQVTPGQEQPGDLIFTNSYLGQQTIGHVAIVLNPASQQTVEAASSSLGVITGSYATWSNLAIYEIWRVGDITDQPAVQ